MDFSVVMTDSQYDSISIISDKITAAGMDFRLCNCKTEDEICRETENADVVLVHFAQITRHVIANLKKCKAIIRGAVGVDNIDVKAATDFGIKVVNVPDYGRDDVANQVLMFALAAIKKMVFLNGEVHKGRWDYSEAKPIHRVSGMTVGLLGFGGIAQLVAAKFHFLGSQIVAYDPYVDIGLTGMSYVRQMSFDDVLSVSDIISVHIPLSDETKGLVGEKAFAEMKKGVILINTARGGVIDEEALCRAIEEKIVSAACLDVLSEEKADRQNPLFRYENVYMTPHSAWYSEESVVNLMNSVADEAIRIKRGEPLKHVVNKEVL